MTDGISDARREERAIECLERAVHGLELAIDELNDAAFGVSGIVIRTLNERLARFNLGVVTNLRRKDPQLILLECAVARLNTCECCKCTLHEIEEPQFCWDCEGRDCPCADGTEEDELV